MKPYICYLALFATLCGGCRTTLESRKRDANTAKLLAKYRTDQEARIRKAKQEYDTVFATQIKSLDYLGRRELDQALDGDALDLSDALASNWPDQTLPGKISKSIRGSLDAEIRALEEIEANLAAARQTYAKAYTEASLEVKKIQTAQHALEDLATPASTRKDIEELMKDLYGAYEKAQADRDRGAK